MSDKTVGSPISLEELRQAAQKVFGQCPCLWQLRVAEAILQRKQDVILTAARGAGKTLTFWIPLLAKPDSIQIVCAPLNILGTINVRALANTAFVPSLSLPRSRRRLSSGYVTSSVHGFHTWWIIQESIN